MHFKTILCTIAFGGAALVHGAPTSSEQQSPGEANDYDSPIIPACAIPCDIINCPFPLRCINGCICFSFKDKTNSALTGRRTYGNGWLAELDHRNRMTGHGGDCMLLQFISYQRRIEYVFAIRLAPRSLWDSWIGDASCRLSICFASSGEVLRDSITWSLGHF